jgi:hypothetical protein
LAVRRETLVRDLAQLGVHEGENGIERVSVSAARPSEQLRHISHAT